MKTYVFRVVADIEEDVFRDIEILGSQNFEDLHDMIIESFDFTGDQMASFYMSDENWDKGEEIGLMDMGFGEEQGPRMMNITTIKEMVSEKNEKILYLYDFLRMWIFYVEFFEERDFKEGTRYPRCIREAGLSPEESSLIPQVAGSLREALEALDEDREFLTKGGVFTDEMIDAYIDLKMQDVHRVEHTTHPVEFDMYYSV